MEETEKKISIEFRSGGHKADTTITLSRALFLISTYALSVNLLLFLMFEYNIKSITAIQICCLIFGFVYMVGLGGAVADYAFFGSFRIIVVFSMLSFLGTLILSLLHAPSETPTIYEYGVVFVGIALALLGSESVINSYRFLRRDQFDEPPALYWKILVFVCLKCIFMGGLVTWMSFVAEFQKWWGLVFRTGCHVNGFGLSLVFIGYPFYRPRTWTHKLFKDELEEVKYLIKTTPLFLTDIFLHASSIMFNYLIILQALTMNRHLGPFFKMPASCFGLFSIPTVFLSLVIVDFLIIPRYNKLRISSGIGLSHVLTILTLVASALIESRRLLRLANNPGSTMSAIWLIIPEAVLGFKFGFDFKGHRRVFCRKRQLEGITSVVMRTFLVGMGYFVSIIIIQSLVQFTDWLPHNINDGRLDYVYWMLAAIGCLNFVFHLVFTNSFQFPTFKYYSGDDRDDDEAS